MQLKLQISAKHSHASAIAISHKHVPAQESSLFLPCHAHNALQQQTYILGQAMLSWTDNAAAKRESDEQVACACRMMTVALFPAVHHSAAETHTFTHTHMQCCTQLHSYAYNTHAHTRTAITCVSSHLKQVHRLVSSCLRIVNSRHSVAAEGVMGVHNFFLQLRAVYVW